MAAEPAERWRCRRSGTRVPRPLDLILSAVGAIEDSLYEELLSPYLPHDLDPVYLES